MKFSGDIRILKTKQLPRRYLVCFMIFLGMFLMHSMRANLSVAVVLLTADHPVTLENGSTIQVREFDWSSKEKGYILSSFFYGYAISEFASGVLANRFGGRNVFGVEMLSASVFNILIPFVATYGSSAIFATRALIGIFEGGSIPSVHAMWSKWAPPSQRTTLLTLSLLGKNVSSVISFFAYGILSIAFGWRILFYLPGVLTILWCVMWFVYIKNDPNDEKNISPNELKYIQGATGVRTSEVKMTYRWKSLFTSIGVWTAVFGYFCQNWLFFFFALELPSYFKDVWRMNVNESGFWIMITSAISLIVIMACSFSADYLIHRKGYPITTVRKFFYTVAGLGVAISLLLIGKSVSSTMALVFVALATIFYSFHFGSLFTAPLDLAPPYASIIMGMMTTAASVVAIIIPILTGYVTPNQTKEEWFIVFLVGSGVSIVGTVVYLMFGSADVQPWARNTDDNSI